MMRGAGGAAVVFALLEAAGVLVRGYSARAEVRTVVDQVVRVDASEAETWALAAARCCRTQWTRPWLRR